MWDKIAKFTLAILLLGSIFLRFYKLGSIPQGLNIDEASYGYDAYSLLKTGRDQWGAAWPKVFYSFGDYKPPGLTYLIFLILQFLPLSTLAVRLPSAIAGLGILFIAIKTLNLLFPKQFKYNLWLVIILATSPWFFGISRLFFEVNVGLFFLAWQIYLILKTINFKDNSNKFTLILIGLLAALAGYMQSSLRYIALGNILFLSGVFALKQYKKKQLNLSMLIIPLVVALIIQIPLFSQWFGREGLVRLQQESGKRIEEITLAVNHNRQSCWLSSDHNSAIAKACYALWNKPMNRLEGIISTGIQTLSPTQLFISNVDRYIIPSGYGSYVWALSVLFLFGFYQLFHNVSMSNLMLSFILLISVGATSLVGELSVHRNAVAYYIIFLVITGGIYQILQLRLLPRLKNFIIVIILLTSSFLNFRYLVDYFYIYQASQPGVWAYNAEKVNDYLQTVQDNYSIIYDDHYFVGPMLRAFYAQTNPIDYQESTVWSKPNQYGNTIPVRVGKYESKHLTLDEISCNNSSGLWITKTNQELPSEYALANFQDGLGKPDVSIYDLEFLSNQLECLGK